MSTTEAEVIEQVESSVENVSPETAAIPAPAPRNERISSLRGKARDHYRLTGDVDAAEKLMQPAPSSDAPAEDAAEIPGATEVAQTEPASGPGTTEQHQRTRQDRNFRQVTQKLTETERELIAAKAKLELYERQSAASGHSAPTTTEQQPAAVSDDDPRPEFPDIGTFEGEGSLAKYQNAVKDWHKADTEWQKRQIEARFSGERQNQQYQSKAETWNGQVSKAREQFKDYDSVVFKGNAPISYATMASIQALPDGAVKGYFYAKNVAVAQKIAELTAMPGEDKHTSYAGFMKWVKSDADRAMLYGEKLALAKAELAKIAVSAKAAPSTPRPLKEVIAGAPRPSAEVNTDTSAAPAQDPRIQLLADINNNVRGAQARYNRYMNEKDIQARKLR